MTGDYPSDTLLHLSDNGFGCILVHNCTACHYNGGEMTQVVIENPILNSPFSEPTRHFRFSGGSIKNAVIAAESFGIGSCYIGDIMENYEEHQTLFELPKYVFPISLVCFGYPTRQQQKRALTRRFDAKYVIFEDRYSRLGPEEFEEMYRKRQERASGKSKKTDGAPNIGQSMYTQKFNSDFSREMNRSVRAMLQAWTED